MDIYLEPEYWSETGQLDDVEKHELQVSTNKLFIVRPKRGILQVGASTVVECSFLHTSLGTSRLPVMLKINQGREIIVSGSH